MPVEIKPLFRPDVLRQRLHAFALSADAAFTAARAKLAQWAHLIRSGQVDRLNERELLPDFLSDLFADLLGYVPPPGVDGAYTLSRERHVEVDGEYADAVLGRFNGQREYVVVLEGKGARDPLDRPHGGRRRSAVEQAYKYAINLPCDWVIVTNIRQIRLYSKNSDQQTYEWFDTERLATDDALLRKLVYLLGAERVLPRAGRCHLYDLRAASEKAGRDLTDAYYLAYAKLRRGAFDRLRETNPSVAPAPLLAATQKLLDRVLFVAFSEDRGLLPPDSITQAFRHTDPYNPRPVWDNFRGLFRAIDEGREALRIPRYNGGLFSPDATLDALNVPDEVCAKLAELGTYEYRPPADVALDPGADGDDAPLVDVDILGHIFEQSITDLERLHADVAGDGDAQDSQRRPARRRREGAFYTPSFITRYIVEQSLGGVLRERFDALRAKHRAEATNPTKAVLDDPSAYDLGALTPARREALVRFWLAWQVELGSVRLLDPACGSGAFLVEAFDQLYAAYERANERLEDLRGHRELFDLDRQILQHNLYGVDLNEEAVEICKLSLWIKTAQRGKVLTDLDRTIKVGNSVVGDRALDPRAFDWRGEFAEALGAGGFDVVVGNPPYVRQELLSPIKPHLEQHFASYHGMADLYVYFYELGLRLLKPGGRLSLVVTNKWLKAGYAEPLRKHLSESAWVESLVDFGHAKQIFEDADVFPCILVAKKPVPDTQPPRPRVAIIPREQLRIDDLTEQIVAQGVAIERERLGRDAWQLEPAGVVGLMEKITRRGVALREFARAKPLRGILTGFNDAFLIDTPLRNALVAADPDCKPLIRPYLRGQDVERWQANWAGLWMLAIKSSENHDWPWSERGDNAESVFRKTFPSLYAHLKPFEETLKKRQDKGRFWWELRSCGYWDAFDLPKITYQEIQFHPWYGLSAAGTCGNNKTFILPTNDLYLLAVLNSPLMWWFNWRYLPHMKDEAMSPVAFKMEELPIAPADEERCAACATLTRRLADLTGRRQASLRRLMDWLRIEYEVVKPTLKLQAPERLSGDEFVSEVKKARGRKARPMTAAALQALRGEYATTVESVRVEAAEAVRLERELSDLVNAAYGLTPDEVRLMWQTAPPRMPLSGERQV